MPQPLTWDSGYKWDEPGLTWNGNVPEPQPSPVMSSDNRISVTLDPAVKTQIITKLNEIRALLPFLVNLTPEEKQRLPRMGPERQAMDADFQSEMAAHPELIPSFVNLAELQKDRALRTDLGDLATLFKGLCESLDDTRALASGDILLAYLAFYSNAQLAAKRNHPGADTTVDRLSVHFQRTRRPATPNPAPGP